MNDGGGISFEKGPADEQPRSGGALPPYPQHPFAPTPGYPVPMYSPPGFPPPGYGGPYTPAFGYSGPPPGPKPSSNIGWAIGAIFLFWPLSIPAFIFSARVDSAWYAGDWFGARKASDDAKKYGMIGVIIGGSLVALYLVFLVVIFGLVLSAAP